MGAEAVNAPRSRWFQRRQTLFSDRRRGQPRSYRLVKPLITFGIWLTREHSRLITAEAKAWMERRSKSIHAHAQRKVFRPRGTPHSTHSLMPASNQRSFEMDKDRIQGSAEQAKGKAKEVAGKVVGDSKME